jgi:hypothetical protein
MDVHRRRLTRLASALCAVLVLLFGYPANGQEPRATVFPPNATALQGLPAVRVDTTPDAAVRRQLDAAEAAASRLRIGVTDGTFYWSSRDNRQLTLSRAGEFTYLSSTAPGQYIRIRRLNDKLIYVEHVDSGFGSVTYWGELRVILGY